MGCVNEVVIIVSLLSVPDIFVRQNYCSDESNAAHDKLYVPDSDHLTLLNIYRDWNTNNNKFQWCTENYLNPKSIAKSIEIQQQLLDIMKQVTIDVSSCRFEWDIVRKCICSAYVQNASRLEGIGKYNNCRSGIAAYLHPTSALCGLGQMPDYVVYHEIVMSSKEYMKWVTAIEPEWLAELCPMFFSIQRIENDRLSELVLKTKTGIPRTDLKKKNSNNFHKNHIINDGTKERTSMSKLQIHTPKYKPGNNSRIKLTPKRLDFLSK